MTTSAMLNRDELIEIGRDAMGRTSNWRWWHPRHLTMLLDAREPLIRADEQRRCNPRIAMSMESHDQPLPPRLLQVALDGAEARSIKAGAGPLGYRDCGVVLNGTRALVDDLRAQVEALPDEHHYGAKRGGCVKRSDVLALLGRTSGGDELPLHRTAAGWPRCSTCDGGGCLDCTDPA